MLLLALASVPEALWVQTTYAGLDVDWTVEDIAAFERLSKAEQRKEVRGHLEVLPTPTPEASRARRSYRKREERLRDRTIRPGTYYARRHSLDPFFDARVSSGAVRTLLHLISRCGRKRTYRALTSCLALDLACHQRTIQRHFAELQAAGYLICSRPDRKNRTTVYLTPMVDPPPVQKNERAKTVPSAAEAATKLPCTQSIKGRTRGDNGDAPFGTEKSVGARAPDPGAELPRPAPPLDQALVAGQMAPGAPRGLHEPYRPGSSQQDASGRPEAEPELHQEPAAGVSVPLARIGAERRPQPPMGCASDPEADPAVIAWRAKLDALDALIADAARSRMPAG